MHTGRGEYDTQNAVLRCQNRLTKALEEIEQSLSADDVFISPFDSYETCGWQFGPSIFKPLIGCDRAELEKVCRKLFRRCQVLQAEVDREEERKIRGDELRKSTALALELMR